MFGFYLPLDIAPWKHRDRRSFLPLGRGARSGHQPLWPETYERIPPEFRSLCVGKVGKVREEKYES